MHVIVASGGLTAAIRRDLQIRSLDMLMISNHSESYRNRLQGRRLTNDDWIIFTDDHRISEPAAILEYLISMTLRSNTNPRWVWVWDREYFAPRTNADGIQVGELNGPIVPNENAVDFLLQPLSPIERRTLVEADVRSQHRFSADWDDDRESPRVRWACSCGSHSAAWRLAQRQARAGHERHVQREIRRAAEG